MSESFIQLSRSEEVEYLMINHPNAFLLLTLIARRARRYAGGPDGLLPGQCYIGDYKNCGIESERKYRTAKEVLKVRKHILICETCRNRKKSTTGATTVGTLVKLISTNTYDVNIVKCDDPLDDRPTTDRRPTDDEQIKIITYNKETTTKKGRAVFIDPILKDNTDLTYEDKISLSQFPRDRIISAFEYANSVKIKDSLIATLIWHCRQKDIIKPKIKKIDVRKEVRKKFPHGSEHNGATCWHLGSKIRFERGMTGFDLDDLEPDYHEKLKNILNKLEIMDAIK